MTSVRNEHCHSCAGGEGTDRQRPTALLGRLTTVHSLNWVVLLQVGQFISDTPVKFAIFGRHVLPEGKRFTNLCRIKAIISHPSKTNLHSDCVASGKPPHHVSASFLPQHLKCGVAKRSAR